MKSYKFALVRCIGVAAFALACAATSTHAAVCNNDNERDSGETCDNGPNIIADGCDDNCLVLAGWACEGDVGESSACHEIECGDGIIDAPEVCDDNGSCCDPTTCQFRDSSFECRPDVNSDCDNPENCTGSDAECPADELDPSCDDGDNLDCTISVCNVDGSCTRDEVCVESCFGPGFYQNHSSEEKGGNNITQAILDSVSGIIVCGHWITTTDELDAGLSAAEQGLCVKTQGVKQRQLFRQLITARLNCAISEGDDCDDIIARFSDVSFDECDALCSDQTLIDPPSEEECIEALSCFNKGGRFENGECVKGTCDDDGTTECNSDDDCPSEDCVRFEDSCAPGSICTDETPETEAEICFEKKGPASSPKICNVARHDFCTIDANYCYQSCQGPESCTEACEATEGCDPSVACTDALPCFNACLISGFPGANACGCEFSWAIFCQLVTNNDTDLTDCLYDYAEAEAFGFCQDCADDPEACAAP